MVPSPGLACRWGSLGPRNWLPRRGNAILSGVTPPRPSFPPSPPAAGPCIPSAPRQRQRYLSTLLLPSLSAPSHSQPCL